MSTPTEFEKRLNKIASKIVINAGGAVRAAAIVADQVVTLATPVDTGRARSNWQAAIDGPASGIVAPLDKSGGAAMSRARAIIETYNARRNQEIHITNNVHYIKLLEDGHSAQAPSGMVTQAVQAANAVIKRHRLLRK